MVVNEPSRGLATGCEITNPEGVSVTIVVASRKSGAEAVS